MQQKKLQKKGSFFVSKCQLWKEKKKRSETITGLNWYIFKEENLSYLGTFYFGALCFVTSHLTFITHAEVTASNIPHLTVVPDSAIIQAVFLGRHTLLTALPGTLHFVLPLQSIEYHWEETLSHAHWDSKHTRKVTQAVRVAELNDFQLPSHK